MTTIKLKNGSGAPAGGDLVQGEPALDLTNKRLYTENASGTVIEVGTNPGASGAVTLNHSGSAKLATTATGIDVTGTVTADGLTVDGSGTITNTASTTTLTLAGNTGSVAGLRLQAEEVHADIFGVNEGVNYGGLKIQTNSNGTLKDRLKIESNGDISFYEDTGATAKLFWDASAESLGIGTSSPSTKLHLGGTAPGDSIIRQDSTVSGTNWEIGEREAGKWQIFEDDSDSIVATFTSSGNVGIGASSPNSYSSQTTLTINGSTYGRLDLESAGTLRASLFATTGSTTLSAATDVLSFDTSGGEAMRLAANGNVGIGTSSPAGPLDVVSSSGAVGQYIRGRSSDNIGSLYFTSNASASTEYGYVQGRSTDLRIQGFNNGLILQPSSGNVGIGTSSPASKLEVNGDGIILRLDGTGNTSRTILLRNVGGSAEGILRSDGNMHLLQEDASKYMRFSTANTERMRITSSGELQLTGNGVLKNQESGGNFSYLQQTSSDARLYVQYSQPLLFGTNNTERMRIDSSGNLLVSKSGLDVATVGLELRADGLLAATRSGSNVAVFRRLSDDGSIVDFQKDGTTVGSINSRASEFIAVGSGDTFLEFNFGSNQINPSSGTAFRDDAINLGASSARFNDIYATNGTIQTSDRNEKQDIEALSDAEQRVAVACKGLLRKFRWKSSVAENGDEARIHFGIIAQDLQDAFTAEGLDAGRYAMFINSTWTDEETGEERSRMGVRYSELLAFIIAAI